ncbi:hypothetical protein KUL72_30660 [Bradyrhizobium arachidis]|uniref:hypothetical protein n=1 Tax=Bradyrhizobium arachidis TaxID=858423 RepID=UPI00216266D7|nr:hypothetical protein [Bradyrhizobium arachidis]UVO35710.1 hypothetical protein KUL72_30660 [Bradyrhizobium arachidis]
MITVGIIALPENAFRRPAGDAGSPATYPCRTILHTVQGLSPGDLVLPMPNPALLAPYLDGALRLQEQGADVVTTTCGFLVPWQDTIAKQLRIPFVASSLLQIPLVYRLVQGRVGIITANDEALTKSYLEVAGVSDNVPTAIVGLQRYKEFADPYLNGIGVPDLKEIETRVVEASEQVIQRFADIKAFVCECHNLPPFGPAIRRKTARPVFDALSLVSFALHSIDKPIFA